MSAGAEGPVRFEERDGIGRVELDLPPVNVLDRAALGELDATLTRAASSTELDVVCLRGRGKAFCAGVSVEDHLPDRVEGTLEVFGDVVERLLTLPVPVVAAVQGPAMGGGCELAAACDVVVARDDATFGQPEIRLGVFPPAAAALLPRLVGRQLALDLILTGRSLGAREALQAGLAQHVFPRETWEEDVQAYLSRMAGLSRPVLRMAKRATVDGLDRPVGEAMRSAERLYLEELMKLEDPREGLEAFLDRREPAWKDG